MKLAVIFVLMGVLANAPSFGMAMEFITGRAKVFVASEQNSGCYDLDAKTEERAVATAKAQADANAVEQCVHTSANRVSEYSFARVIKYRGAGCLISVSASYSCDPL